MEDRLTHTLCEVAAMSVRIGSVEGGATSAAGTAAALATALRVVRFLRAMSLEM